MGTIFGLLNNIALFCADNGTELTTGQRILLILGIILAACAAVVIISLLVILIRAMIQAGINLKRQGAEQAENVQNDEQGAQNIEKIDNSTTKNDKDVDSNDEK